MEKIKCKQYEGCSAPLCPLDNSLKVGIWYSDEDICNAKKFQTSLLIKQQNLIAEVGATNDKYFTTEMLLSKKQIRKGIEGIDPDQSWETAKRAEKKWMGIKGKRVVAKQTKKSKRVVAKKKANSKKISKKRGRPKNNDCSHKL